MKFNYLFLIFTILYSSLTCGQSNISGKVVDIEGNPLEYATVSIHPNSDATTIQGTITDGNGAYSFAGLENGKYTLIFQMLGFEQVQLKITVNSGEMIIEDIKLTENITQLDEVEIIAERSIVENELGKKVLRIGNDLSNTGTNAIEAMERIPSVTTTQRGGIQIRGSSNIIIYINGKETTRSTSSLRYIPAESLSKIEVITNPSAKYDAEGVAGIINIVYKRTKKKPLKIDGILNVSLPASISGGFNASLNRSKYSFYSSFTTAWNNNKNSENFKRLNSNGELSVYENNIKYSGVASRRNLEGGVTYEPDSTLSANLEINYSRWADDNIGEQSNIFQYRTGLKKETFINENRRKELEDEVTVSVTLTKSFNKRKKLQLLITASGEDEDNFTRFENLQATQVPPEAQQFLERSDENEQQRFYQVKLDYETPFFQFGTLETGLKMDYIKYDIFQKIILQNDSVQVADNIFSVNQQKYAAYALHKKTFKDFEYAIGIRLESFLSDGFQQSNQETFKQNNTKLFPSLQLQYNINERMHTIGLSYTRRINRPGFFDINPYVSYSDPLNLETGNPKLQPEFAGLLEINHHIRINKFTSDITGFYRRTDNVIQTVTQTFNENQTLQSLLNFNKREDYGFEVLLEFKTDGIFNTYGTFSLAHTKFEDDNTVTRFNNTTAWGFRLNQQFKFPSKWTVNVSQTYQAPRFEPQRKILSQFYINTSVSKKLSNGRGSLTLSLRDILNTREFGNTLLGDGFTITQRYKYQSQRLILGLRYTILE